MNVEVVERLSPSQVEDLCELYGEAWWTQGRHPDEVRRMLDHTSGLVGLCDRETGRLVAFARFLTDCVYKALVFDVIVGVEHQGRGLGRDLMDALREHPGLRGVEHIELYCLPEVVPFYRRWGFDEEVGGVVFLRAPGREDDWGR